ncbi:hypothetical protein CAEBREN_03397 [Caenorhabditis brenneri]|uniref:CUT domain-containing protein n=1 Tax=Caenorhabditis brenneri TaxID=135651 RepID=G0NC67_CAEBE|nr:hypothetical protein CAEBREN_03397 [Caenorhabditis brenneri]
MISTGTSKRTARKSNFPSVAPMNSGGQELVENQKENQNIRGVTRKGSELTRIADKLIKRKNEQVLVLKHHIQNVPLKKRESDDGLSEFLCNIVQSMEQEEELPSDRNARLLRQIVDPLHHITPYPYKMTPAKIGQEEDHILTCFHISRNVFAEKVMRITYEEYMMARKAGKKSGRLWNIMERFVDLEKNVKEQLVDVLRDMKLAEEEEQKAETEQIMMDILDDFKKPLLMEKEQKFRDPWNSESQRNREEDLGPNAPKLTISDSLFQQILANLNSEDTLGSLVPNINFPDINPNGIASMMSIDPVPQDYNPDKTEIGERLLEWVKTTDLGKQVWVSGSSLILKIFKSTLQKPFYNLKTDKKLVYWRIQNLLSVKKGTESTGAQNKRKPSPRTLRNIAKRNRYLEKKNKMC